MSTFEGDFKQGIVQCKLATDIFPGVYGLYGEGSRHGNLFDIIFAVYHQYGNLASFIFVLFLSYYLSSFHLYRGIKTTN